MAVWRSEGLRGRREVARCGDRGSVGGKGGQGEVEGKEGR